MPKAPFVRRPEKVGIDQNVMRVARMKAKKKLEMLREEKRALITKAKLDAQAERARARHAKTIAQAENFLSSISKEPSPLGAKHVTEIMKRTDLPARVRVAAADILIHWSTVTKNDPLAIRPTRRRAIRKSKTDE